MHTETETKILIFEIKGLLLKERDISDVKKKIRRQEALIVFRIAEKLNQLASGKFGTYKPALAEIGMCWSQAMRYRRSLEIFGPYKDEKWLENIGKSAMIDLSLKTTPEAVREAAINLAKSGEEVGVMWVRAVLEGRISLTSAEAPKAYTIKRMSANLRKTVRAAIDTLGEEVVVETLVRLLEEDKVS